MNKKRAIALASAALVAGLVIGNISGAFAVVEPSQSDGERNANENRMRIGPMMRDAGGRMIDTLADLTGLTAEDVRDQRAAGESVADIAGSAGVDVDAVVDTTIDARENALDDAVAAGALTREEADAALERMRERMQERVTSAETGRGVECGMGAQARGGRNQNEERGQRGGRGFAGERGFDGACGASVCPNAQ